MMAESFVLATDLDGTMAGGSAHARTELVALLGAAAGSSLIYVTGRTADGARHVIDAAALPEPDVLIADVGTSVLHGAGPARLVEIEAELERNWPGGDAVRARLAAVHELAPQDVAAPRRVSYWIEAVRRRRDAVAGAGADPFAARAPDDASLGEAAAEEAARARRAAVAALDGLDVDVLVSANVFLDVLPAGVNKGSTLRLVLRWLGRDEAQCIVAGDSLNDLALFETAPRGIAVGNCEPALRERVQSLERVYCARGEGAAGVLEGLRHFGCLRTLTEGVGGHGE